MFNNPYITLSMFKALQPNHDHSLWTYLMLRYVIFTQCLVQGHLTASFCPNFISRHEAPAAVWSQAYFPSTYPVIALTKIL